MRPLSALAGYLEGIVEHATLGRRIAAEAEAGERQVEASRISRERDEAAQAAARAEDEGYPLGGKPGRTTPRLAEPPARACGRRRGGDWAEGRAGGG